MTAAALSPSVLTGARITLRPYAAGFSPDEVRTLYRWACDPDLLSLISGFPLDMTFEQFEHLFCSQLERHNSDREQLFAILDESGRLIGRVGLFGIDARARSAELGIVIGERDRWGHGYGRDAIATVVDFAMRALGIHTIRLYTYPDNARAQRAFAAVGFRPSRELRRFTLDRGSHSELEMLLTAGDHAAPVGEVCPPR